MTRKKSIKYISIILIISLFCIWIWFKFIRTHIPRDIPFNLSLLTTVLLIISCLLYLYTTYVFILSVDKIVKHKSFFNMDILNTFLKSIEQEMTKTSFNKFVSHLIVLISNYAYLLVFVEYIIRIILLSTLIIDISNHKLFYIYKVGFIYLIIYIIKTFIYCCKIIEVHRLSYLNRNVYIKEQILISNTKRQVTQLQELINILTILKQEEKPPMLYSLWLTDTYTEEAFKILSKKFSNPRPDFKKALQNFKMIINFVVEVNYIIYIYYFLQKKGRILDITILFIYFICWLYILFISLPNLHLTINEAI